MQLDKSINHICFRDGYEYFWVLEPSGKRYVARADIANPMDVVTKQRVGGRFEGTEAWYQRCGQTLFAQNGSQAG